ncbi:MAG: flavodoxin family protein [Chloroflexi bacterium]|nr:flavodoxin family protein [Chloroflexota bacterium]
MKITAFNGSPRGAHGNTHVMVEAFLKGAEKAGAEVENIFLVNKNIKHCLGCFACWFKTPGRCIQKDDMEDLLEKYMSSDVVICATPLYVDHVTGIMKNFMDRIIPIVCPQFQKDECGQTKHVHRYDRYPAMIMISNCGFPEQDQFALLKLYCKRMREINKAEVLAEIYRSQGPLLTADHLVLKPVIGKYKRLLMKAGEEIVTGGKLSDDTVKKLEEPLIPEELYIQQTNKYMDEMVGKV